MSAKKPPVVSEDKQQQVEYKMRLALEAKRPMDAIEAAEQLLVDTKSVTIQVAFLICASYRAAINPLRKLETSKHEPPADAASVASLQLMYDVDIQCQALIEDAIAIIVKLRAAPAQSSELTVLLLIEDADFKRYLIETRKRLEDNTVPELIQEVSQSYEGILTSKQYDSLPASHYLRLRLTINYSIFLAEYLQEKRRAFELISANQLRLKSKTDVQAEVGVAQWPVGTDEINRLQKKIDNLAERYSDGKSD
jgi:14-3-3 protein